MIVVKLALAALATRQPGVELNFSFLQVYPGYATSNKLGAMQCRAQRSTNMTRLQAAACYFSEHRCEQQRIRFTHQGY